jgi:branched-subunit amino acid aminotransferase/4-amino-4-deoxychorismate lyase
MKKKRKRSREELVEELLRTDENARRLKERIERGGGRIPVTEADREELTRELQERIARGYADERRASS